MLFRSQIAKLLGKRLNFPKGDLLIHNVAAISEATNNDITFLSNKKYTKSLYETRAKACIVPKNFNDDIEIGRASCRERV